MADPVRVLSGIFALGSMIEGGVLVESSPQSGYVAAPFTGTLVAAGVVVVPQALSFGPAVGEAWAIGACAILSAPDGVMEWSGIFPTITVQPGQLLTLDGGTYGMDAGVTPAANVLSVGAAPLHAGGLVLES